MYSVVLLAALTTGGETPEFHRKGGYGCYGACYGSCYAGCYGGSYGTGHGCWGRSYGCYGSCASSAWWGHYSSCYGYDIGCVGNHPRFGSCHGFYPSYKSYNYAGDHTGCHGCYGCYGCYGGCYGGAGCQGGMAGPTPMETPPPGAGGDTGKEGTEGEMASARRARLIVSLPEGARLFVDGQEIKNAPTRKTFRTPALAEGETYFYEVRAEVMREGKPATETRRVLVRAGEVSSADFSRLGAPATASARR